MINVAQFASWNTRLCRSINNINTETNPHPNPLCSLQITETPLFSLPREKSKSPFSFRLSLSLSPLIRFDYHPQHPSHSLRLMGLVELCSPPLPTCRFVKPLEHGKAAHHNEWIFPPSNKVSSFDTYSPRVDFRMITN